MVSVDVKHHVHWPALSNVPTEVWNLKPEVGRVTVLPIVFHTLIKRLEKNITLFADWKQTWSNRDRAGRCTKIQLNWIQTYQEDHLPTPSCCSLTHPVFNIQGLTFQVVLNPPSTDYLSTIIIKFPDFSRPWKKLPFSPNFPGLEWGIPVSPSYKDGMNTKKSETRTTAGVLIQDPNT